MTRDAWLEINLDNLKHNIKYIKSKIKNNTEIMAVIKADAYGHGYSQVAKIFIEEGVNNFAFATLGEAIEFKKEYKNKNAMILGALKINGEQKVIQYGICQSVQSYQEALRLDKEAKNNNTLSKIHINIDTGMSRFGFLPENKSDLEDILRIFELKNTKIEGIFTHFSSSADEGGKKICEEQMLVFENVLNNIKNNGYILPRVHVSNSGAILLDKDFDYDMVRMGIVSYGLKPSDNTMLDASGLKPLMSLKARVVSVRNLEKSKTVGYSQTYKLDKKETIATLPLGYADGLRAKADNSYQVLINGYKHNLAGRICMDAMMIRVNPECEVKVGDEVTFFGECDGELLPLENLSDALGYINYELVTGLKLRLKRYYIYDGEFIKL